MHKCEENVDQLSNLAESPARLPLDESREMLMVQVAKQFFSLDRTQTQIAADLGLTRWQVSRLLSEARESGVVRIQILPRSPRLTDLEAALQQRFNLREAIVLEPSLDGDMTRDVVARAAGQYLAGLQLRRIGVSWGRSMAAVAEALPPHWADGVHVVQINGAISLRQPMARVTSVAEDFARAGHGSATLFPAPAIVGNPLTRQVLEQDRILRDVYREIDAAEVLCFSFGALSRDSVHVSSGYLETTEIDALGQAGAVGDILGRFVDAQGAIVDTELDARTIGLPLASLTDRPHVIGVAAGAAKHAVTLAALRARYVNVLITDAATARYALANASPLNRR